MRNNRKSITSFIVGIGIVIFLQQNLYGVLGAPLVSDVDHFRPIKGGWHLRLSSDTSIPRPEYGSAIGVTRPRSHETFLETRRLLYPPADRSLIWTPDELKKLDVCVFRPFVLAYGRPRFVLEYHSAGGVLGHIYAGLTVEGGPSKWFHQWSEIDMCYVDGRMEYTLQDEDFPGTTVSLRAAALSKSVGVILKITVEAPPENASVVWGYGGASAFFTPKDIGAFSDAVGSAANTKSNDIPREWEFDARDCSKDIIQWKNNTLALHRAFDKSDAYVTTDLDWLQSAIHYLPDWKAVIRGGSVWNAKPKSGFGDPHAFTVTPKQFTDTAQWISDKENIEKRNTVAVQQIPLTEHTLSGYIVVGMGGNVETAIKHPSQAWLAALERNRSIAERVVTHTPDPYLDSAMTMMAFANDGLWADVAMVHGGWSWRLPYLGWRILYGPNVYGWTDRVKTTIQNHVRFSQIKDGPDRGALGHIIEQNPVLWYNMNEVFLDMTRHYFDYTNDLDLMREIFHVLQGVVEWESRRLQPENEYLYESSLNTWISDSHWYIRGQCTQASAYMLNAHHFLADVAERLGENPEPFRQRAEHIRAAMQRKLWMPRVGAYAEYQDTLGNRLLHPEPELATIYHAAEFGAAEPLQIYQMLYWADTHLKAETTPNGGKIFWSSNWFPNNGRSFTHSTYELAYAEELNLAVVNYLGGRAEDAYSLIRGVMCGIYNNPAPGSLSCHTNTDGTQRRNLEFADPVSMWGRAVVEGMFGIVPKRQDGTMLLTPQLPKDWPQASIKTPHFAYDYKKKSDRITIDWSCPAKTSVQLKLPLYAKAIEGVYINNKETTYQTQAGVGFTWLNTRVPASKDGQIKIKFSPTDVAVPDTVTVKQRDSFSINLENYQAIDWLDPQSILKDSIIENGVLKGTVNCEPGFRILFLSSGTASCPVWLPLKVNVEPKDPVKTKIWKAPEVPDKALSRWVMVDLSKTFNSSVTDVLDRILSAAVPPQYPASNVSFNYRQLHLAGRQNPKVSDDAWRKKINDDNIGWTTDGIPFKSPKTGSNIGVVSLMGGFPDKLRFEMSGQGTVLYLMLSGITFPNQSHVINLCITLHYTDGTQDIRNMVSPFDIGDCWSSFLGRFHDTAANGFENIGGRSGPAGSKEVDDLTKPIAIDTEAHLVQFELKPDIPLEFIELEAIANDVAFGIMGATILKE